MIEKDSGATYPPVMRDELFANKSFGGTSNI